MVVYRCYVEDVTADACAVERGFLHPDNRTAIYYKAWVV